jgi:3-(3-hydroxy-phenyl)propionate hydroxylase
MAGSAGAGSYFPQAIAADGTMLDEVLGLGQRVIARADLATPPLAPFADQIGGWLDKLGAEAVLVRPDRYVFGTGTPRELEAAWDAKALS